MLNVLRTIAASLKTIWLLLGITLGLLAVIELGAFAWLRISRGPPDPLDSRVHADGYRNADWVEAYYREFAAANHVGWQPYVYWRRKPYAGQYINIDAHGVRKTWNPSSSDAPPSQPRRIFVFGGSVMWGTGARDDNTIASLLSRQLSSRAHIDAEVTNFAEGGYVTTQETIALMRELQRGNVPDLAIFFDGVNDAFAAFQAGEPGIPQNESHRIREFNIDERIYREAVQTLLTQSSSFALIAGPPNGVMLAPAWDAHMDALSDAVVRTYASTVELLTHLAQDYHFKVLLYWQPVIFTKQRLTPYEQGEASRQEGLKDFYVSVYGKVRERLAPIGTVRDLGALFANDEQPEFIDFCHLTEAGNDVVAAQMLGDVVAALQGR